MAFLAGMAPAASSFLDVPEPSGLVSPSGGAVSSSSSMIPDMPMPAGMTFDAAHNAFRVPVTQAQHDEIMNKVGHG